MTISVTWAGGTTTVGDDGSIRTSPVDREDEVFAALEGTYTRFESVELTEDDPGTIVEVIEQIDRASPDHVRAALLSLPGALELDGATES